MQIEDFITWSMKYAGRRYLRFADASGMLPPKVTSSPIQLYVHIPYCTRLCPYCSFHRVAYCEEETRSYFKALRQEIELYHKMGFVFDGVYIGGGTPTVLPEELLLTLELINRLWSPSAISVETNPDRLEPSLLKALAEAGVKRVSVGIQTFDDELLKLLDRYDKYGSASELKERLLAASGCVPTLNVDMIYNFPLQSQASLENDLRMLKEIAPDQVTFYPLMVSDATRHQMESLMGRHSYRKEKQFYGLIMQALDKDYRSGSAWCFTREGATMIDEYIVTNHEYVGVGSGAFGLVGDSIYANTFDIRRYIELLDQGRLPLATGKTFSRREMLRYNFLMDLFGLRLDRQSFRERFGRDVWRAMPLEMLFFTLIGALRTGPERVELTRSGQYCWVTMMREFFTGVDNFRDASREAVGIKPAFTASRG